MECITTPPIREFTVCAKVEMKGRGELLPGNEERTMSTIRHDALPHYSVVGQSAADLPMPPYCDANGMALIAELRDENARLREAIRKADRRLDDISNVQLGAAAAVVVEAHLYLKAVSQKKSCG